MVLCMNMIQKDNKQYHKLILNEDLSGYSLISLIKLLKVSFLT